MKKLFVILGLVTATASHADIDAIRHSKEPLRKNFCSAQEMKDLPVALARPACKSCFDSQWEEFLESARKCGHSKNSNDEEACLRKVTDVQVEKLVRCTVGLVSMAKDPSATDLCAAWQNTHGGVELGAAAHQACVGCFGVRKQEVAACLNACPHGPDRNDFRLCATKCLGLARVACALTKSWPYNL
jgi:hypothetical protein